MKAINKACSVLYFKISHTIFLCQLEQTGRQDRKRGLYLPSLTIRVTFRSDSVAHIFVNLSISDNKDKQTTSHKLQERALEIRSLVSGNATSIEVN